MRLLPLLCLLAFGFLLPLAPAQAVLLIEINPGSEPATPEQLVAMKSLQKLYADYWAAQQAAKADGPMDVEQHLAVKNSATSVLDIKENLPGYMVLLNYHSSFYEWNEKTFNPALTLETFKQYESLYRKGIATYKDLPLQEKWADILLSVAWANLMLNNPPDALKYANEAAILRGNVYSALWEEDRRLHNPTEKDPKVAEKVWKISEIGQNVAEIGRARRLMAQALVQTDKIRDARTTLNHARYDVIRLVQNLTRYSNYTEISDDTKIMIEATLAGMDNQQGLIELQLGNLAEAQKWFRQAWQRTRPDNAPAHALIAAEFVQSLLGTAKMALLAGETKTARTYLTAVINAGQDLVRHRPDHRPLLLVAEAKSLLGQFGDSSREDSTISPLIEEAENLLIRISREQPVRPIMEVLADTMHYQSLHAMRYSSMTYAGFRNAQAAELAYTLNDSFSTPLSRQLVAETGALMLYINIKNLETSKKNELEKVVLAALKDQPAAFQKKITDMLQYTAELRQKWEQGKK